MPETTVAEFAADVRHSLMMTPRQVPSKYLYDALGSALFEAICELPWYRVTQAEAGLLERCGPEILSAAAPLWRVVELGSGSGNKLTILLGHRAPGASDLAVRLIDVSRAALVASTRALGQLPGLNVVGHEASYEQGVAEVADEPASEGRTLTLFLGSNIGNFNPPNAAALLGRIRASLRLGDTFLLGTDLVKPEPDLLRAYDDPLGVTAAFNLNVCVRMNRELGATFDLKHLRHVALWNAERSRVEMHIEATEAHDVTIPGADMTLRLEAGERIWTESSYKYEPAGMLPVLREVGFEQTDQWIDSDAGFALTLATAI